MIDPVTMAVIGGTSEAMKTALGISQAIKANRIARQTKRPAYEIPGGIKEGTAIARNLATTGLPGYQTMQDNLSGQTAGAVRSIKEAGGSGPEKLAAIAGAYGSQMNQSRNLGVQNAQAQVQNQRGLQSQLGVQAGYQDKAWQWNQQDPYVQAMAASQRLREGANQNIYGGLKGMAGAAMMGAGGGMTDGASGLGTAMGAAGQTAKPATTVTPQATPKSVNFMPDPRKPRASWQQWEMERDTEGYKYDANGNLIR